jgi:hypothetical protein
MNWEGEAPAEPKTAASGEQQIASGFLEGSAPALPKIFGTSGDVPSSLVSFHSHRLQSVDEFWMVRFLPNR